MEFTVLFKYMRISSMNFLTTWYSMFRVVHLQRLLDEDLNPMKLLQNSYAKGFIIE